MSDKPVIEYGNAMMVTTRDGVLDQYAVEMLEREIERTTSHLRWISDLEWIDPPAVVKAPKVDAIQRIQAWGWYGKFASEGYGELRKHFACRLPHLPERITLRYALKLWWHNRKDWR